jgi:hypothetical protein
MNPKLFAALGLNRTANMPAGAMDFPVVGVWDDFTEGSPQDFKIVGDGIAKYEVGGTNATSVLAAISVQADRGTVTLTTAGAAGDDTNIVHTAAAVPWTQAAADPRPWVFRCGYTQTSITTNSTCVGVGLYTGINAIETQSTGSADIVIVNGAVNYRYKTNVTTVTSTALLDPDTGVALTVLAGSYNIAQIEWDGKNLRFYFNGKLYKSVVPPAFTASLITAHAGITDTSAGAPKAFSIDYLILVGDGPKAGR